MLNLGRSDAWSEELEANMTQRNTGECSIRSVVGAVTLLAIGYILFRNIPDIVRYIRISRM
jgi:hypothetical protein